MARLPRTVVSDRPVHITQRGNNRQLAFLTSNDFRVYWESLRVAAEQTSCAVHAYALMTNHVHLLISPPTPQCLSWLMQSIGRRYVRYVNDRYKRTGTLWEGRFRSAVVDSERYLLTCMRYIELNPVRAGLVDDPSEYQWSSFASNALGHADAVITPHPLYIAIASDAIERRSVYRQLFIDSHGVDTEALAAIRSGTITGMPIGNAQFRATIATTLNRSVEKLSHGGDRRGKQFRGSRGQST